MKITETKTLKIEIQEREASDLKDAINIMKKSTIWTKDLSKRHRKIFEQIIKPSN